ncbi:PorT family protein [Marinoscillum pacificum]|uniref:PorT family protein n=1 Tax=Marinoscillum pacificum TaxID=392723 RepID=UPI002158013E|nr:PorT family protein [Marinoscillum pacificum]
MRIIVGIVLLVISSALNAQVKGYIGISGGGHFQSAYIEHTLYNTFMSTGFDPGYHGGVMFKLFTNQSHTSFLNAGLQSGLQYETKGWRQTFDTDEPTYHVKMDYITFPLDAIIYGGKRKTKIFATLGIFLEQLISVDKDTTPNLDNLGGQEFYTYEEDRDRKLGYGVKVSVGIHRDFPFGALHLDGFLSYSASSFIKTDDFSDRLPDLTNHYLGGFTVAYLIPFGKMEFSR